jgi:hypothetical protein
MNSYKSPYCLVFLVLLLTLGTGCTERSTATKNEIGDLPRAGYISWVSSAAIHGSMPDKKPVTMLIIMASSCASCDSLRLVTLRDSLVMGMINAWYNPCIFDADSDSLIVVADTSISCYAAARKVFNASNYPTIIFFNLDGTRTVRTWGFYGPGRFVDILYLTRDYWNQY